MHCGLSASGIAGEKMENYLEFRSVGKNYPGVRALDDVSFRAQGGQIVALLGENGAGKSSLLKIISGDQRADDGEIILNNKTIAFSSPHEAISSGVSVIYQERQIIPGMSVMENIFLGALPKTRLGLVNGKQLRREAQGIVDKFNLPIDVGEKVGMLNVAYQQMVEIMKAYRRNSTVIAFDEPTAPLTDRETDILFNIIEELKAEGKILIYVSHRLSEVSRLADKVVILKDGKFVSEFLNPKSESEEEVLALRQKMITLMVGRDIGDTYANLKRNDSIGDVLLDVRGLTTPYLKGVDLIVRRGEIVGLAGLVGAGRTEVARAIFGADPVERGEIFFDGQIVSFNTPSDAINLGMALCPEDRKDEGLVLTRSVKTNVIMSVIDQLVNSKVFVDNQACADLADAAVEKYSIRTTSIEKIVGEMSGGNQQKVILGRWTNSKMPIKLLILDEPTKGIDVGTKAEIYQMVCDFADMGIGVIFISSELTEVINLADTIVVMHNGRITGKLARSEATEKKVLELAMLD